jgi:hypothetical protein
MSAYLANFHPGETVLMHTSIDDEPGLNFAFGETVKFQVIRTDGVPDYPNGNVPWYVTDGGAEDEDGMVDGRVFTRWYVEPQYLGASILISATGLSSGARVEIPFTDFIATIDGFVIADLNGNGLNDSEPGIPGVTITLYRDNNFNGVFDGTGFGQDVFQGVTTTGLLGEWSFSGMPGSRNYFAIESNPAGYVSTNAINESVSQVVDGTTAIKIDNDQIRVIVGTLESADRNSLGNLFLDSSSTATTTTIASAPAVSYGNNGLVSVTVSAAFGAPVGSLTLTVDGTTNFNYSLVAGDLGSHVFDVGVLNAGTHTLVASYAGSGVYLSSTDNDGDTLLVNKAILSVVADDAAKLFGIANPNFTATFSGFAAGESLATSGVTGSPSLTTAATQFSLPGTYAINAALGTLAASNYDFTFADGSLAISAPTSGYVTTDGDGNLVVIGTGADDCEAGGIALNSSTAGDVAVSINGSAFGSYSLDPLTQRVIVYSLGGVDCVSMSGPIILEAHGGDGNDSITGGGGNDVLLGENGDDLVAGLGGNDVVVGGVGSDRLFGSSGNDILIAGDTGEIAYATLRALMNDWLAEVGNGDSSNVDTGSEVADAIDGETVDSDGDRLSGASGSDLFIISLDDVINDAKLRVYGDDSTNREGDVIQVIS